MTFSLFILSVLLLFSGHEAAIPYFNRVREVAISVPDRQNYIVVDEELWNNTEPHLADIRLVDGDHFHPFVLKEQRSASTREEQPVKLLNLGTSAGHTQFDLDLTNIPEYDHVRLQLSAKDFVTTASVEGESEVGATPATNLGSSTLYDFSRENLGSNFTLKLPTSRFRFLHVVLNAPLIPQHVRGATVFNVQEKQAAWTHVAECKKEGEQNRSTTFRCALSSRIPLSRISFEVATSQTNFRRDIKVLDAQGSQIASGNISRVRLNRNGTQVVSQTTHLDLFEVHTSSLKIQIENGDDQPLQIPKVVVFSTERRIYFDPQGRTNLKLYYGDPQLAPAVFDYPKFFQEDPAAVQALLSNGVHNPAYSGRPDERPWSERHQASLWVVMIIAVAVLASLALRGFKTSPSPPSS